MRRVVCCAMGVVALGTASCSTSKVNTLTLNSKFSEVSVNKVGVEGHYQAAGKVSATTTVKVVIVNDVKTITGDGFAFSIDKDGGKQYQAEQSKIYIGNSIPIVTAAPSGGMPSFNLFGGLGIGGGKIGTKEDRDYATDVVNYQLIQKAREIGSDAFLDSPVYDWEIVENSEYQTLFWFFRALTKYEVEYKVTGTVATAKLEYRSISTGSASATPAVHHLHTYAAGAANPTRPAASARRVGVEADTAAASASSEVTEASAAGSDEAAAGGEEESGVRRSKKKRSAK